MNIKGLVPEEYSGYNIYIEKFTAGRKYKRDAYRMAIQEKETKRIVDSGTYKYLHTKEEVLKEAKQRIDGFETEGLGIIKPGDIFVESWGYDQTQYDFLIVKSLSPSGKTAKCRMVRPSERIGTEGEVVSDTSKYEEVGYEFQMKVDMYRGEVHLRGQYPFIMPPDESKRMGSFTKAEEGRLYYETPPGMGH